MEQAQKSGKQRSAASMEREVAGRLRKVLPSVFGCEHAGRCINEVIF
jgi:hypothetical protein